MQQGQIDSAAIQFEKGLSLKPNDAKAHLYLGEIYRQQKRSDLAQQQYALALQYAPPNSADANAAIAAIASLNSNNVVSQSPASTAPPFTCQRPPLPPSEKCSTIRGKDWDFYQYQMLPYFDCYSAYVASVQKAYPEAALAADREWKKYASNLSSCGGGSPDY